MKYPFEIIVEVIFRDLDALGHTNNTVYLTWTETARIKYTSALLGLEGLNDWPLILAEVTCTFKQPTYLGQQLQVGAWVNRLGTKSFDMYFHMNDAASGTRVAECRNALVFYDYQANRSAPIPERFRTAIAERQAGWEAPA